MLTPDFEITAEQASVLKTTENWVRIHFEEQEPAALHRMGGHGFDKSPRTAGWAAQVAAGEGYPPFLPALAVLLIDIGRTSEDPRAKNYGHGQLSREMSADFLQSLTILTSDERVLVADAIEDHPKLNENVRPTWLVKVVMDADRLDCLGPLGSLRAASGLWDMPLILPDQLDNETTWKGVKTMYDGMRFQLAWYDMLWTETARKIARPRVLAYRELVEAVRSEAQFTQAMYQRLFQNLQ